MFKNFKFKSKVLFLLLLLVFLFFVIKYKTLEDRYSTVLDLYVKNHPELSNDNLLRIKGQGDLRKNGFKLLYFSGYGFKWIYEITIGGAKTRSVYIFNSYEADETYFFLFDTNYNNDVFDDGEGVSSKFLNGKVKITVYKYQTSDSKFFTLDENLMPDFSCYQFQMPKFYCLDKLRNYFSIYYLTIIENGIRQNYYKVMYKLETGHDYPSQTQ